MMISRTIVSALAVLFAPTIVDATSNFVSNNECTSAIKINDGILPFFDSKNGSLASFNPRDPLPTCAFRYSPEDGNTMWYQYYSDSDGILIADITDSAVAPIMTLFSGTSCNSLREVSCVKERNIMYYQVTRGRTYYIKTGDADFYYRGTGIRNLTLTKERNYFYVVDDVTNLQYSILYDLFNGESDFYGGPANTIDYSQLTNPSLSIATRFTSTSAPVRSVRMTVDNTPTRHTICDNRAPYTLFGDNSTDIFGSKFSAGNRVVTATAFSNPNCSGSVVGRLQRNFFVRGCELYYSLYDAKTEKYIKTISNGTVITNPPCEMSIGLTFLCGFTPKNVQFILRQASNNAIVSIRNDTSAPYFLFGDNHRGNIFSGSVPPGNYLLTANIDGILHKPINFTISGQCRSRPVVDTTFDVDIRLADRQFGTFTLEQAKLFRPVLKRLTSMIVGDMPDTNTTGLPPPFICNDFPPVIDDLHICVGLAEFNDGDGFDDFLSVGSGLYFRESDGLPFISYVLIDASNFQTMISRGLGDNFLLQQFMQTLGLGIQWSQRGLAERYEPCSYNGTKAKEAFKVLTGCSSDIPLDLSPFPSDELFDLLECLYWDEECLKDEIMTATIGRKKVSRVTLGSLEDLGYKVNYAAADPYGPNDIGVCTGCNDNHRGLKEKVAVPSCRQGNAFERAVRKGNKMLQTLHSHHVSQPESTNMPKGIVYKGNQHLTVSYRIEDGTMCSAIVSSSGVVL